MKRFSKLIVTGLFIAAIAVSHSAADVTPTVVVPTGIVPSEPARVVEGLHRYGDPFISRQMNYSATGRLINSVVLDEGWGTTPTTIPAGTPVFGVELRYIVRENGSYRPGSDAYWCGVVDTPRKQLGNTQSFCSQHGAGTGRRRTASDRLFNPPDWVRFVRRPYGGTDYFPISLGIGATIKGLFEVRPEPVDFGKRLSTSAAVMSWGTSSIEISEFVGDQEKRDKVQPTFEQTPANGKLVQVIGGETVLLEKVDEQSYRATIVRNDGLTSK
jgi:hypothetical protein